MSIEAKDDDEPGRSRLESPATDAQRQTRDHTEELLDEALDESFPASDPPSITAVPRKP